LTADEEDEANPTFRVGASNPEHVQEDREEEGKVEPTLVARRYGRLRAQEKDQKWLYSKAIIEGG
jgi:hypothetical protein